MSHHNTEFRTLYKVGLADYGQEKKKDLQRKRKYKRKGRNPTNRAGPEIRRKRIIGRN